jgi:hypothetical protein
MITEIHNPKYKLLKPIDITEESIGRNGYEVYNGELGIYGQGCTEKSAIQDMLEMLIGLYGIYVDTTDKLSSEAILLGNKIKEYIAKVEE